MSINGWGAGGSSGFGPSTQFMSLPFRGYRNLDAWVEEFVDAMGNEFDIISQRFLTSSARANLLDPTYTPTDVPDNYRATATAAPLTAVSKDSMLDMLLYLALGIYPADTNLTVAQKQALTVLGPGAIDHKGNRQYLLALAAAIGDGVAVGWTVPPFNFSIILPDGAPAPGYGSWVQSSSSLAETNRPWILSGIRNMLASTTPSFVNLGVGYSQFRAGYSSAGETVFPSGVRTSILNHEHFDAWAAGVPTSWTKTGTATLTQSTTASAINWEYTGSAAVLDLTSAAAGASVGLSQSTSLVNNQLTHRLQLDYSYTNTQTVGVLAVQVTDSNSDGNTYYWNVATGSWTTTVTSNIVPPSTSRARYAFDVVPQAASSSALTAGTSSLTVAVSAKSDGTATTATTYTIYRVGLYEKFSLAVEQAASGERTAWYPLVDAPCWTSASRTSSTAVLVELANAARTAYKLVSSSTGVAFSYHPAISGRGYQSNSAWTNLLKGSNDFGADWTLTNATRTASAVISPIVAETSASAVRLNSTATGAKIVQGSLGTPTSKSYVGGVWVKKVSTDGNFNDVTLSLVSTSTKSTAYTLKQSQGWQLLPITATFGGGDVAALQFQVAWGAASANGQIAVASAYLYDVTGKAGVLYPPIIRTPIGATATLNATTCQAVTQATNTNVLHPLLQRALHSVVRGALALTIVPMFDASSQPSQVVFDIAQGAAQNRVTVRVNAGALELRRWDNAGNQWVSSLTLSSSPSPGAGVVTWLRDTALSIRCLWDENSTMISAGNGNASGTKPGSWAPSDASVAKLFIGSDTSGANQFDGVVRAVECIQLGAPAA